MTYLNVCEEVPKCTKIFKAEWKLGSRFSLSIKLCARLLRRVWRREQRNEKRRGDDRLEERDDFSYFLTGREKAREEKASILF